MRYTGKFNDFVELLKEDNMIPNSDRQMMGLKSENEPFATNVNDFFSAIQRKDVSPENIPYPLNKFDDISSDAYIAIQNLENILKVAEGNAVIKNQKSIGLLKSNLISLKKEIVDIANKVNKIK